MFILLSVNLWQDMTLPAPNSPLPAPCFHSFWSPQRPIYTSFRFRFSALRSDQPTSVLWPLASRLLPHAVSRMPYAFPSPLACHAVLSRRKEAEAEAARRRITHYHGSLVAAATRLPYASCRMRGEAA
jgi:hypothetical protein